MIPRPALLAALGLALLVPTACVASRSGVRVSESGQHTRQDMTLAEAKQFTEYPVYYLGDQFDGQRVDVVQHNTAYGPNVQRNRVTVIYWPDGVRKREGDSPTLHVVTERATAADFARWKEINQTPPPIGELRSNGGTYWMHLLMGDVLVEIVGASPEEVERMRNALRPLNPPSAPSHDTQEQ